MVFLYPLESSYTSNIKKYTLCENIQFLVCRPTSRSFPGLVNFTSEGSTLPPVFQFAAPYISFSHSCPICYLSAKLLRGRGPVQVDISYILTTRRRNARQWWRLLSPHICVSGPASNLKRKFGEGESSNTKGKKPFKSTIRKKKINK